MQLTDYIQKLAVVFLIVAAIGLLVGVVLSQLVTHPVLAVMCFCGAFVLALFLIELIFS